MIIVAHYFMCEGFASRPELSNRALELAITGVFLFFALSGLLIKPSLERSPNLWQFYKRKLIRIVVPFVVSYLILSIAIIFLALIDVHLADRVPIFHAMYGANYLSVLLGIFPVDLNVTKFFNLDVELFVGEWFMGVLLWLYLLSPFLVRCAERFPIISLLISIGVSYMIFYATADLSEQGKLFGNWSIFLARIPEFLFGMILWIHREKILKLRRILLPSSILYLAAWTTIFICDFLSQGEIFFPSDPSCFAITLPAIYFLFTVAELLNERGSKILTWFNSFGRISYMAMLIQHVIIYTFADAFNFSKLHSFGRIYILLLIIFVIVVLSRRIKIFSDSTERKFLTINL